MTRVLRPRWLWFALATLTGAGCAPDAPKAKSGAPVSDRVEVGVPVPPYTTIALGGDSVSLAGLHGKVVLLNVWATWCHPCRDEIPELEALHQKHKARGLEVVGVSVDAGGDDTGIREFMREFRMTYAVWRDPDERVSARFLLIGVPATFLIDRQGILRWRTPGPIRPGDSTLALAIERAL